MKLKKTYKFAIYSALYIAGFATALVGGLLYWFFEISWMFILLFFLGIGLFTFLLTQYRVERFIYRSIQKIYKDVSMIDSTTIINHPITTDMATLTEQVKKFATDKKDRKSTRLNSSHVKISYAVFCLKKKKYKSKNNSI